MKQFMALLACVFALGACGNQSDEKASTDAPAANGNDSSAMADNGQNDQSGKSSDNSAKADSGDFASPDEKRSYALGMDIGNSLKELPVKINTDSLTQGVRDVVDGADTKLTQKELDGVMQSFVQDMESAQKQKAQEQAQTNAKKGEKFLADNKDKEGVKTTDSGLQYKVMTKGDGPSPGASDSVTVHYTGKLIDGTVFDSSRKRGEPVTFPVDAVIPGWTEALQLMKQGAKYELYIPADLAYGERGAGAQIGPNETLIFDVELLKVDNKGDKKQGKDQAQQGNAQTDNRAQGQSEDKASAGGDDAAASADAPSSDNQAQGQDAMSEQSDSSN